MSKESLRDTCHLVAFVGMLTAVVIAYRVGVLHGSGESAAAYAEIGPAILVVAMLANIVVSIINHDWRGSKSE